MGLRDTEDQLDACRTQSIVDEARIEELETETAELRATIEGLARQNAELEHDLARAESALADRLQHDAHARPTAHTIDRDAVLEEIRAAITEYSLNRQVPIGAVTDRIIAMVRPTDQPDPVTIDRAAVAQVFEDVLTVGRGTSALVVMDEAVDRILALVQPADGICLTAEEAALTVRAARHSAESIRAVLDVDPARLHPDVAGYVDRLTDLADRLTRDSA